MRYTSKIRSFILASFTCTAAFSALSVYNAEAQNSLMLNPQTTWSVNQVGDASNLDNAYCAIARQFGQSTILTIARNPDLQTSIAIDVQSVQFNPGQGLRVKLDPGSGEQRAFQVFPANEKAVVVRLGQDEGFFRALQDTGFLRAELGAQDFRFNISDMDQGELMLSQCVNSLNTAQPFDSAGGVQKPSQEMTSLQSEIEALRAETQRLSRLLSDDDAPAVQPLPNKEKPLSQKVVESQIEDMAAPVPEVQTYDSEAFRQEQREAEILRGEVRKAQDKLMVNKDTAVTEALKEDNDRLRAVVTELENEIARTRQELQALKISAKEGEALKKEIETSQADWSQTMASARERIVALEEENNALNEKLSSASGERGEQEAALVTLTQQLERSRDEYESTNAQLKAVLAQKDQMEKKSAALKKTLETEIAALKEQVKEKDTEIAGLSRLTKDLALVKSEKEQLELELESKTQDQALTASLQRQIKTLEASNEDFKKKNDALLATQAELKSQKELQEQKVALLQEELKGKLDETQSKSADMELRNLELRKQNSDLLEKVAKLQKSSAHSDELKIELKSTLSRIEDLEQKLKQAKSQDFNFATLESRSSLFGDSGAPIKQKKIEIPPEERNAVAKERTAAATMNKNQEVSAEDLLNVRMETEESRSAGTMPTASPASEAQAQEMALKSMIKGKSKASETKDAPSQKGVEPKNSSQNISKIDREPLTTEPKPDSQQQVISWNQDERVLQSHRAVSDRMGGINAKASRSPAVTASYRPSYNIEDIVTAAEIVLPKGVQYLEGASTAASAAYAWQISNIYGTAELQPLVAQERFDDAVKTYLEKTQNRCAGDFAVVPEYSDQIGEMRIDSYDIACVGGKDDGDSSASLLFFNKSGTFTALAHEGPLSDLDATITLRNRLKDVLLNTSS